MQIMSQIQNGPNRYKFVVAWLLDNKELPGAK